MTSQRKCMLIPWRVTDTCGCPRSADRNPGAIALGHGTRAAARPESDADCVRRKRGLTSKPEARVCFRKLAFDETRGNVASADERRPATDAVAAHQRRPVGENLAHRWPAGGVSG